MGMVGRGCGKEVKEEVWGGRKGDPIVRKLRKRGPGGDT